MEILMAIFLPIFASGLFFGLDSIAIFLLFISMIVGLPIFLLIGDFLEFFRQEREVGHRELMKKIYHNDDFGARASREYCRRLYAQFINDQYTKN